jgi:ceramide glucosyltransferase
MLGYLESEDQKKNRETIANDHPINPKVCNLLKAYSQITSTYLWVLDSNIYVSPSTLTNSMSHFSDPLVSLVHHVPCAIPCGTMSDSSSYGSWKSIFASFGTYLDTVFLSITHARTYTFINLIAIASCVIGKSNIYHKPTLDTLGGLEAFSGYMAEDNVIGIAMMGIGKVHRVGRDIVWQSLGFMGWSGFLERRVRWIRVRKYTVTAATLYEPFSECIVCGVFGAFSVQYWFGDSVGGSGFWGLFGHVGGWFLIGHFLGWILSDLCIMWIVYGNGRVPEPVRNPNTSSSLKSLDQKKRIVKRQQGFAESKYIQVLLFLCAWIVRELVAFGVYVYAMAGRCIVWRGKVYTLFRDGRVVVGE